ncbi:hypothetical protein BV902_17190 [Sphingobacterium sp. B29]|uniref:hypothetical protein n=1 Tax=Sphingobacterium sp. B29 TaxID=1933220 RepID=UPI000957F86A|nr:hypothetical protein [Sphingobacterium sp. B29]APU97848.1 hypothetical protein BV902_17190 [Sphingobacterium sp. B29]
MFFVKGSPDQQEINTHFVSNATGIRLKIHYSFQLKPSIENTTLEAKLDRILDLLQEQQYTELHKLTGTMTIHEVAYFLSKSVRTIERRIAKGLLKATYKEGNADLFLKKDVVQLYVTEYKKWPRQMP